MITVKSGLPGDTVALWERHEAHPGGEIFVAGARVVEVSETYAVQVALQEGRLVEVKKPAPKKTKA